LNVSNALANTLCCRRGGSFTTRAILVRILWVGAFLAFRLQRSVLLLEGVGDVLEEDQAEDDVLVLRSVHAAAQCIGHLPELGFITDGGAVIAPRRVIGPRRR
jgi:hypothetical protein